MKLVFVAVSLIVVLRVDCRSSQLEPDPQHLGIAEDDEWPEPDPLHLDIAEDPEWPETDSQHPNIAEDPQWTEPKLPFGPFTTTEPTSEEPTSEEPTSGEANLMVFEEDSERSDSESRAGCKPNGNCKFEGGYCVTNASQCLGILKPGGCKGGSSCQCCIPGCPTHFTNPLGNPHCFQNGNANQCFCLYRGTARNFMQQQTYCKSLAPQFNYPYELAHPLDANFTHSYLVQKYGYVAWPFVNARGSGSYQIWQDSRGIVPKEFYTSYSPSTSYCTLLYPHPYYLFRYPGKPYFVTTCSNRYGYTLCEYK